MCLDTRIARANSCGTDKFRSRMRIPTRRPCDRSCATEHAPIIARNTRVAEALDQPSFRQRCAFAVASVEEDHGRSMKQFCLCRVGRQAVAINIEARLACRVHREPRLRCTWEVMESLWNTIQPLAEKELYVVARSKNARYVYVHVD